MIKIIYDIFGKLYRKVNICLSIFYLNKFKLKKEKYKIHEQIFKLILRDKKKKLNSKIDKKNLFPSFIKFKLEMRKIIFNKDKLKNFLTQDEIHKVMCGLNRIIFYKELKEIMEEKYWKKYWKKIIIEDYIGNPIPYFIYPKSSGNRIHETFNIMKLIKFNKLNNKVENIFEFGGGYGGFCNLYKKIFKVKKYIIYDLPEVSYIQFYYLKMLGYNVKINSTKISNNDYIYLFSDIKLLNKFVKKIRANKTLFISNWGFSETPIFLRKKFEKFILKSREVYFAFQQQFGKIDNLKYFNSLFKKRKNFLDKYSRMNENHFYLYSKNLN